MSSPDGQAVTIVVADPELAAIFGRIARAIRTPRVRDAGLAPKDLLTVYATLLEEGASVSLLTSHEPIRDPEL